MSKQSRHNIFQLDFVLTWFRFCEEPMSTAAMQMLAWESIAIISSCGGSTTEKAEAVVSSSAQVLVFVALKPF